MKFIDSSFTILPQGPGKIGGKKLIEKVGRTCYCSGDKITEDSYQGFYDRMVKSSHLAMVEFWSVYLKVNYHDPDFKTLWDFYDRDEYSMVTSDPLERNIWITTNMRVILEHSREADLQYLCETPEAEHHLRWVVQFVVSRSVSHEIVRHRKRASYAQQSQRYVCYSKDRFGGEISFIVPDKFYRLRDEYAETIEPLTGETREYLKELSGNDLVSALICTDRGAAAWYDHMKHSEDDYKYLTTEEEWTAQDARDVLPNATATIINVCMYEEDWKHFLDLRSLGTTGKPDPNMKRIAEPLMYKMIEEGVFDYNEELTLCHHS